MNNDSISAPAEAQSVSAPVAKQTLVETVLHGDRRIDNYAWLREKENPEVIAYLNAENAYTDALLKSIPVPDPTVRPDAEGRIQGELPSPLFPPSGCRFRTRCPLAQERCAVEEPLLRDLGGDHYVACHFPIGHEEAPPGAVVNGDGAAA